MNSASVQFNESVQRPVPAETATQARAPAAAIPKLRVRTLLAVPVATFIALAVHLFVSKDEPAVDTRSYSVLLGIIFGASALAAAAQPFWSALRGWLAHMCPIIAAAVSLLCAWEVITSGFRLLPLPYFPS